MDEQQLFEQSATARKRRTSLEADLDAAIERLVVDDQPSDASLLSRARAVVGVKHDLVLVEQQIVDLQADYDALRSRRTEDVPIEDYTQAADTEPPPPPKRPSARRPRADHPWLRRAVPPKS